VKMVDAGKTRMIRLPYDKKNYDDMLRVSSFGMNTCPQTFVPLIHCIIDYTLSLVIPDFCRTLTLLQSVH